MKGQLTDSQISKLNELLAAEAEAGNVISTNFPPSLNKVLKEAGAGTIGVYEAGAYKVGVAPSLKVGERSDVLPVVDVSTGEVFSFYAATSGMKGKLAGIPAGDHMIVVYQGQEPSKTPGYQDMALFAIYRFPGANGLENAKSMAIKMKKALSAK